MELFEEISASTYYAPFILSKLSISMSLKSTEPLQEADFKTDNFGLELNRQTITGEWDELYKSLIEMFEKVNNLKLNYKIAPRRQGDVVSIYADTTLANTELGWKAERSLEDTLMSAWKWEQYIRNK